MINNSSLPLTKSIHSAFYSKIQSNPPHQSFKPKPKSFTPDRILLSSPQINLLAYEKESKPVRSKMIQAVCSSPGVLDLFLKNKLFVKGKDSNAKFITKTLPISSTNIAKEKPERSMTKPKPQINFSNLTQTFRKALNKVHNLNKESPQLQSRKNLEARKGLFLALSSIEKQCEVSRSKTQELAEQQKTLKNWTSRMQLTASNLQKWSDYTEPIVKELFDYEAYAEDEKKIDADEISRGILNKSSREIRDQAKLIKKILIKKKEKIL